MKYVAIIFVLALFSIGFEIYADHAMTGQIAAAAKTPSPVALATADVASSARPEMAAAVADIRPNDIAEPIVQANAVVAPSTFPLLPAKRSSHPKTRRSPHHQLEARLSPATP
jgi:hypothetical protein